MTDLSINGLILAGGRSSRMGYDKSLIEYHSVSQREYLFTLLKKVCDNVYTSCKTTEEFPISLNPLADQFNLESPLNGIMTAFATSPNTAWLTVPVDMPLINDFAIAHLLNNRDSTKTATCFFDSDGKKPEPLFTIWETSAYPLLLEYYKAGNKSPREFLMRENIHVIEIPDKKFLININDSEELKRFRSDFQF
jgi:molybdenum cofactor guanylyltransferase